jgi:ATP-binding cassette subfamily C protein CydC
MTALLRILTLWRRQQGLLLLGVAAAAVSAGLGLALPVASARLAFGASAAAGTLLAASAALRWLGASRVLARYAERLITHAATFNALAALRTWLFRGLAVRSAGGLGLLRSGDALSRIVGDVEALDGLYLRILVPGVVAALAMPVLAWVLLPDGWVTLVVVLALFLVAGLVLPVVAATASQRAGERLATARAGLRTAAMDTLDGLREVRAYGAEGRMLAAVQAREATLFQAQRSVARMASLAQAGAAACGAAALLAVLVLAPAGAAAAVAAFMTLAAFELVAGMPRAGALAGYAAAAASRVLAVADSPPPVPEPAAPAAMPSGTAIRFEGVVYGWTADRPRVLDGLTLDIPAGSRVAVLGPSGSGKSTLAALLLKVVAPTSGRILLGGVDLADLSAGPVRSRMAWLSQATHLFSDTVRANLLLGRPDASDADLWAALEQAQVAEVVRLLPGGLDAWIGQGGSAVSGGQARRLALARTLLSNAPVLILDEPATGLDADTERAFLTTLNDVAPGRTVILIVHRLLGVERLDRIYRLSTGRAIAAAA